MKSLVETDVWGVPPGDVQHHSGEYDNPPRRMPRMIRRDASGLRILVVVCGVAAVALAGGTAAPEDRSAAGEALPPAAVELLEPGAEPRRQFRYTETPSATRLEATVAGAVGVAFGGGDPTTSPVPTTVMNMSIAISPEAAADRRRFAIRIEDASLTDDPPVNPMIKAIMEKYLPFFKGFEGSMLTEATGLGLETSLVAVLTEDPQAQQPLQPLYEALWLYPVPFPQAAIGVGAKWRVSREWTDHAIKENLRVQRVLEYELARIEDARLHVLVELHDTGETRGEAFVTPLVPPMTIHDHESSGDGRIILDARDCALISGTSQRTFAFDSRFKAGEQPVAARTHGEFRVMIERSPDASVGSGGS
jgi:hypothetical protein